MNAIKLIGILLISMFFFVGCGPKTGIEQFLGNLDRLAPCMECVAVIQDIEETETLQDVKLDSIINKMQRLQKSTP